MTPKEMKKLLKTLGVKKNFKPVFDDVTGTIYLKTKLPPKIEDGIMSGTEICLSGKLFVIWTSKQALVKKLEKEHGFKVIHMAGESIIYIPADKADKCLTKFGAYTREVNI